MRRFLTVILTAVLVVFSVSGCGKKEEVQISLWIGENYNDLMLSQLDEFEKLHKNEANFTFNISFEGEDTCKDMVLQNPESAADIFIFVNDQFEDLYQAGALLEITQNVDGIKDAVGGEEAGAIVAVTREDKLYAYPMTAGNGYFLYYDKSYFSDDDLKTLDGILDVCDRNGKLFAMNYNSGWYIYSFFKGAGMDVYLADNQTTNYCNWNDTSGRYTGVDVANAMMDIAAHPSFANYDDAAFVGGLEDGTVIAGVSGQWNAGLASETWGENYGAVMLPTYTIDNTQVQMYSFMGYKLVGVNANTASPKWAMELAEFLTNEDNQVKRFQVTGECPANVNAAANEAVVSSPAVSAIGNQAVYSTTQSLVDTFWDPSMKLGITLAAGNRDGVDMQQYLDEIVEEIEREAVDEPEEEVMDLDEDELANESIDEIEE